MLKRETRKQAKGNKKVRSKVLRGVTGWNDETRALVGRGRAERSEESKHTGPQARIVRIVAHQKHEI